jgi:hypothetical protein
VSGILEFTRKLFHLAEQEVSGLMVNFIFDKPKSKPLQRRQANSSGENNY